MTNHDHSSAPRRVAANKFKASRCNTKLVRSDEQPPPSPRQSTSSNLMTMWLLPLLGYIGVVLGFLFLTLSIASGLYYLSELVEEHTVTAKRLLTQLINLIILLHLLLALIDRLPLSLTAFSIASHLVYRLNLRRFPSVRLTDVWFLASCLLVVLNHWVWFRHFSSLSPPRPNARYYSPMTSTTAAWDDMPTFKEVASFFGIMVWLVPFSLFVSLSAGEMVLPSMTSSSRETYTTTTGGLGDVSAGGGSSLNDDRDGRRRRKKGMAKAVVDGVRDWMGETGQLLGFWRAERRKTF
ncbi:MAG: erv26 super protein [Peltula sp. TS41687]|nr:MAG: erv26 super protein [Peltula sp. TS41687]